jgi:uncharacterized protein (DUF433 family)
MDNLINRIEINPKIMLGKPIIKGTRITVQNILELLGANETYDNILEAYPNLTVEDIRACIQFASRVVADEFYMPQTT